MNDARPFNDSTAFLSILSSRFDLGTLDRHPASAVGVGPDMRIAYVNSAWNQFASANGGEPGITQRWGIGSTYLDAIPAALRPFYESLFARVPDDGVSMHPVSHAYECSSPTTFRKFNMQVYGLPKGAGFVIVNTLVAEAPHRDSGAERLDRETLERRYRTQDNVIVQCAHCRRVRRAREHAHWDWVPAWVARSPSGASHGLCGVCEGYYYPDE